METIAVVGIIIATISTGAAVIGCVYAFMRNFKVDVNAHIDKFEKRMDKFERHQDLQDQRMFYLATGRTLADAMKDEKK